MARRPDPPPPLLLVEPFSTSTGLAHTTKERLRSASYQRLGRGARMAAGEELTHGRRIQGFLAVLPPRTVLAERSAAWAHGVRSISADDPVVVVLMPRGSARSRPHLQVRARALEAADVRRTPLGLATTPARTAADLLATLPPDEAVPVVDELLRRTATPLTAVGKSLDRAGGRRGVRRARAALALVDPLAESPRESLLRLLVLAAGLPAPVCQHEVWDGGRFVARLDLAWPDLRLGLEYDGDHHRERRTHSRDLHRHNRLRALGWTVVQVDARAMARAEDLVELLRGLVASRTNAS